MAPTVEKVSDYMPDDIAFYILAKLPLKSVKRFSCASKSWNLLFENSYFMNMFQKKFVSKNHSDGVCLLLNVDDGCDDDGRKEQFNLYLLYGNKFENKMRLDWPYPYENYKDLIFMVGGSTFNGTLCIYGNKDHHCSTIVLWNPATKELNIVPQNYNARFDGYVNFTSSIYGFGYDHTGDDYKIVQCADYLANVEDDSQDGLVGPFWLIYSLRSNDWKRLNVNMPMRYTNVLGHEFQLNGVCYWTGKTKDYKNLLVSFNLTNEVPSITLLPLDLLDLDGQCIKLVGLNEYLAIISEHRNSTSFYISITILGESGAVESWTKLFDVELAPFPYMHTIGAGNGDIFFNKAEYEEQVCFDLTTRKIEEIGFKALRAQLVIYNKNLFPMGVIMS